MVKKIYIESKINKNKKKTLIQIRNTDTADI